MKLSEKETELLLALPKSGRAISSTELIEKLFGDEPPFHARSILRSRMETLIRKLRATPGGPRVSRTQRRGPYPIEYRRTQA